MTLPLRARRVTFAVLTLLVWLAAAVVVGAVSSAAPVVTLPEIVRALSSGLAGHVIVDVLILGVATVVFGWRDLGFQTPDWRALRRVAWFPFLTLLPFLALGLAVGLPPGPALGFMALNTALIALSEEWMFRGILFHALRTKLKLWPAVLLTSALFGAVHVLNVFALGDLRMALAQSVAAMMTGMLLVALMLRTGSIWPSVIYHMLWNLGILLIVYENAEQILPEQDLPLSAYLTPMLAVLPNLLFALLLLRKVAADEKAEPEKIDKS